MQISKTSINYNNIRPATLTGNKTPLQLAFTGRSSINSSYFKNFKKTFTPLTNFFNNQTDKLNKFVAKGLSKVLLANWFQNLMKKTKGTNIVQHITCLTSLVLSGFYVKQTLQNDKLEKSKRTTLAINQAAVALVSAVSSYTLDNLLAKQVSKFTSKFIAVNAAESKIGKYADGIRSAQSIIVFGTVYRFIAPVLITPFTNSIGNRMQKNKETKSLKNQA